MVLSSGSTGAVRTPSTTNSRSTPLFRGSGCHHCRARKVKCDAGKPFCLPCVQHGTTDKCKYDQIRKSKLTLVKEENAELKERIARLERELAGRSPPANAPSLDDIQQPPSSTFSQMGLEADEDIDDGYEQDEGVDDEARGDPIATGAGSYETQPQPWSSYDRPEHLPALPVHDPWFDQHSRVHYPPQSVQVSPGQYQPPLDQYQPAYQDPYYSHVPHSALHTAGSAQAGNHVQPASYTTPHVQTGSLPDLHGQPTWPHTSNDPVPLSASTSGFTPSPSGNQWHHLPHLSPETTPGSPGTSYSSTNYPRGAMFRNDGRYVGGAMASYDARRGTKVQALSTHDRAVPSPPIFGHDVVISFFQRWRTEFQPQAYVTNGYAETQTNNSNWTLVGNWWERDDLSVAHRDYLLGILLPYRKQIGLEIWVPDFLASLHLPPQSRPHPGFMWMLYTFAAFFSGEDDLKELLPQFMERARRNLEESFAKNDRLFDYIRGQTLYASILYMMGRVREGGIATMSACRAAIVCGLHKISSAAIIPVAQTQERAKYRIREIKFELAPATSEREHGERIAAFWQLLLVDLSTAATTGMPAVFRDDGDERSRVETVFPRPLEEYFNGDAAKVPYATLGDIFTSKAMPNPPDIVMTLQVKATALLERAVRLATKWNNGKHLSTTNPIKYGDDYNIVLQAIQHFKSYLPGLEPREGNKADSHLYLTSRGLVYERLFPHFMILNAEVQIYSVLEEQDLGREKCVQAARGIKDLIMRLTDEEIEQIGVLLTHCLTSAIHALMREEKFYRAHLNEAAVKLINREVDVISHALKILGRTHRNASVQSEEIDRARFKEFPEAIIESHHYV
ncbi:hypothetical protein RSOLAG1IB_03002 [Rhizoctonia solani AG-1 IB]|uniref:Zn(2)-C6 fungal-type domain-containing protein n=1 Tax=Thanatephorus cucumeris (strain AG1-IB / isolate 7/3/14) TaxID=1108050 RepID=A0A0B7FJU6_THACB|nr:hypothetical protein RSOLAG1IB_03002 [Rhizoctonia solani AG-1 IB]